MRTSDARQAARLAGRARHVAHRARGWRRLLAERARSLLPVTRTAMRIPAGNVPPPPSAFAAFGERTWLVPPARVLRPDAIAIGSDVVVLENSTLWVLGAPDDASPKLTLGDGVRLTRFNSVICEVGVSLGAGVASSDCATVVDTWNHPFVAESGWGLGFDGLEPAPVRIGDGAYLGMNSLVLPGVTVGEGAFVGEGAVVFDDVPAHSVVYGNPARVVRHYDRAAGAWQTEEA